MTTLENIDKNANEALALLREIAGLLHYIDYHIQDMKTIMQTPLESKRDNDDNFLTRDYMRPGRDR